MTVALGLSYAFASALAFLLIASVKKVAQSQRQSGSSVIYSANGLLSQPGEGPSTTDNDALMVVRDVSFMAALAMGLATVSLEGFNFGGLGYWNARQAMSENEEGYRYVVYSVVYGFAIVIVHMATNSALLVLVSKHPPFFDIVYVTCAHCSFQLCFVSFLWLAKHASRLRAYSISKPSSYLNFYGLRSHRRKEHVLPSVSITFNSNSKLQRQYKLTIHSQLQRKGAFTTSLVPLAATLLAQLATAFTFSRLWFTLLCVCSAFIFVNDKEAFSAGGRMRLRLTRVFTLVAVASFLGLAIVHFRHSSHVRQPYKRVPFGPAPEALSPVSFDNPRVHPIDELVRHAEQEWLKTLDNQSQTLEQAVAEYRRRYGMPPPPNFHKWFEFAQQKGVQLLDEYDMIYHSLLPFWALSPATIRARTREALGFPNQLVGLMLRDGKALHVEGGPGWQQEATIGMMQQFAQYLPDMDLAFNVHDEPRVVVPHDELSRLIEVAQQQGIPAAASNPHPKNTFSARPKDLGTAKRIAEVKTTRFNVFAHQPVWIPSRMSCSPDSPARALDDTTPTDNLTAYAISDMSFVYNHTAFSDICNSPSFATSHGFFDRPNAFNVVHELFPIFSQSKMSSFQDILYPSPWYWFGKVEYNEKKDPPWEQKENKLWWRGSTTGGFSRGGGWRRQHRQKFVGKVNALDTAQILTDAAKRSDDPDTSTPSWQPQSVSRQDYKDLMDVHFSHIGQCDPGDCDAQREFFEIVDPADQQDAWQFKYLLDMDGNAFSGRFYAFLQSHSLTFKMAVFREWHEEWIKPWVHYVPFSLRGEEVLETVRYFSGESEGRAQGARMAEAGSEWAGKALRKEDFEVWFFRLLLE